jgi:hypothetical protein
MQLWKNLANEWKPDFNAIQTRFVGLTDIHHSIEKILAGGITGRVVLQHGL